MHAHRDPEEHGSIEIKINGCAGGVPHMGGRTAAAITGQCGLSPADMADLTGCVADGSQRGDRLHDRMEHRSKNPLSLLPERVQ